jgi:hypothetical protein
VVFGIVIPCRGAAFEPSPAFQRQAYLKSRSAAGKLKQILPQINRESRKLRSKSKSLHRAAAAANTVQKVNQSCRNAVSGSTFVARRAGIQQASSATLISNKVMTAKVSGSVALTPNNRLFITRVNAKAPTEPSTTVSQNLSISTEI